MVQVAKRKKGRPSKADLARRAAEAQASATESDSRRSLRRKNVRYNIIDYDGDYIDDEEDERRREKKKLKLMTKLHQGEQEPESEDHTPMEEEEECDEIEGEVENEDEEEKEKHEVDGVIKGTKVDSEGLHSISVSVNYPHGIPLPDRKILELILDKLQKKDIYGVFAEPVDPEELPDYHDVIENPMDFATARKKLANGSYPTLEQFESDIFLICSNAMQYNAPETVYHRQARTIQELGRKKFEKLRIKFERTQVELKSEQKTQSNSSVKKSLKKPPGWASQESVSFDLSYGEVQLQPTSYPMQGGSCERPGTIDGIVEANAFFIDANQDKAEDVLSGKNILSKMGRKSFVLDENRRGSYNMSNQLITRPDSTCMTFESGMRQLVTVGVHAECSYTRSLARFSASLGPIVWNIASHRIQQALPADCKFGRGWVGEYEPIPTPIFMLTNHLQKETSLITKLHSDKNCKDLEPKTEPPVNGLMVEGKRFSDCPGSGPVFEGNPSIGSAGVKPNASPPNIRNQQNSHCRNVGIPENKSLEKEEPKSLPSSNQNNSSLVAKFGSNTPTTESKTKEMAPRNLNTLPSTNFKQPDTNEVVSGELPDGKVMNTSLNNRSTHPSSDTTSNQTIRAAPFLFRGQEQGSSDPVKSMRMFTEEAQKPQTSHHSPADTLPQIPSAPSAQRDASGNASAAAAQTWMSAGAGGFKLETEKSGSSKNQISADSLHNSTREFHQHISRIQGEFPSGGMSLQSNKNNFPFHSTRPQPSQVGAISQFPNRPMVFPQSTSVDQSRFQMQTSWQGLSPQSQPRQKQETLPPDLNIDCQSPGSPAKQSSGVVDSQQPDLALQL
ncbi:uncharacterized protein LOC127084899 isoform X2 [Lathyrus oleraceus]|uniref:Bromo domain-containing protein n=1 Tax=Pisum sativum TaxID=3888 RepID=A0A9D4WWQ3_PEA|nr:uncharacterized protein LOC127084899 isoform X2 [Pisum sativum]KAI5409317.1 hypothetical protein KIW84_054933 [Pisum sativum]